MPTRIYFGDGQYSANLAKVKKLGFDSYTARERKYEPQTQNTFAFQFLFDKAQVAYIARFANNLIGSTDVTGYEKISTEYDIGLKQINNILNESIQGIQSPTKTVGQIVIDWFNTQVKYAGKPTYSNANITFNTFIGLGTKNVLAGWNDLCMSERTNAGGWARSLSNIDLPNNDLSTEEYLNELFPKVGYKVDGNLLECARDGSIVNAWKYVGMWINTFTPGNYAMSGSNSPSQISASITVDKIMQSDEIMIEMQTNR